MALVGLAVKLALMSGTRVFPSVRFVAPGFLSFPLAIRIAPANDFIGFGAAWNALAVTLRLALASNITNAVREKRYFIGSLRRSVWVRDYDSPPIERWQLTARAGRSREVHCKPPLIMAPPWQVRTPGEPHEMTLGSHLREVWVPIQKKGCSNRFLFAL